MPRCLHVGGNETAVVRWLDELQRLLLSCILLLLLMYAFVQYIYVQDCLRVRV